MAENGLIENVEAKNILEVRNLHYIYSDGTQALKALSLGIKQGKTTAVLGSNGAGKSTLLLSFNGINKPSGGEVLFKGLPLDYSVKGLKQLRKSVGIVFQDPDKQLFSASVYQDISFGAMNLKLPEEEVRRRVDLAMKRTGISHLKDKPTHSLSFGQKKRAAIAGVLVMEPEVLILDEPTAGLDPLGVSELMKLLRKLQIELNLSVVISTHDIDIVPLYCDYAYVIDDGRLVMEGTPQEVFSHPEEIRRINLRLPRIGHLMEILHDKDGFEFAQPANTISEARKALINWKDTN
ncbi:MULTISPECIES: ATP-binding cassette domain-containing protein [unclassified Dehalobacter]|uniref:ATP-binding cassette domain-containing protein n=1 Tax=unclassified Dehalobacter TaxID=2635733 RepID=UPI000E6CF71E|nr:MULTISPECIES: ATP-binding cassette domain-containing protein [unclassified Dehalobacter]RJE47392.1 energy-coupling factor ABC transporter ATP-binding protein [Dehalobacter sp. MCB1]TCX48800.1 energy-coupling factor ABC transporter ATP-binding protein [Dehalobacter sp. 14DCB1]TCX56152.1 energy-coupling factor ABC transporter ATP-binding protein [Dehalobacter sp. 12DCB1]